jgi:hypothetical protein
MDAGYVGRVVFPGHDCLAGFASVPVQYAARRSQSYLDPLFAHPHAYTGNSVGFDSIHLSCLEGIKAREAIYDGHRSPDTDKVITTKKKK